MNQFLSRSFHHPRVLPLPSLSGLASRHCRCPHLLPLASGAPAPSSSRLLDALRFRSCPQPSGLAVRPPFLSSFLPTTLPPPLVVVPLADWSLAPSLEEVDGNREAGRDSGVSIPTSCSSLARILLRVSSNGSGTAGRNAKHDSAYIAGHGLMYRLSQAHISGRRQIALHSFCSTAIQEGGQIALRRSGANFNCITGSTLTSKNQPALASSFFPDTLLPRAAPPRTRLPPRCRSPPGCPAAPSAAAARRPAAPSPRRTLGRSTPPRGPRALAGARLRVRCALGRSMLPSGPRALAGARLRVRRALPLR
ncbi:hypothetical protein EJB05_40782, partial [Eragrostis curvula]